jgi:thiopeptide-type bacteriocin biosynthesis protein
VKNPLPCNEYTSSGFFVLRTPLLPIEEFLKLASPTADSVPDHAAAGGARAYARTHLRRWVERPEVREALWLASPELVQSLATWRDHPESAKGQKLEQTLYRYFARMTARATPFGAFAGCTVGEIADHTRLELDAGGQNRRYTRLDMEYLCNLAEAISLDPALRHDVRFRRNTSLHLAADRYHHLRGDWHDGARLYRLVATEPTPAIDATLRRAASGATARSLASALVESDPEITPQEAQDYVAQLIESQLLVSDLAPPVTGLEPVAYMIQQLEQAGLSALAAELSAVAEELRALDRRGLGADLHEYEKIASAVSRLGGKFNPGRLVQVDVIKPAATVSLDERLVNEILRAIETLHSIQDNAGPPVFQRFKDEFHERYQEREVGLMEALDDEAGIGFENEDNAAAEPLIAGIDFRPAETPIDPEVGTSSPTLLRRVEELLANKQKVLELDAELLAELKTGAAPPLPDAFAAMGVLFETEGQRGCYLQSVLGPSGANLLARFCHASERLTECAREHVRAEESLQSDGPVFAEVVHLPEGRVGNVVCRPSLREYEIPFLATSGVPASRQIPLSGLTVSLRGGRIVLRSQRLGREVLPRLTSAHNFTGPRSLKLYKFLCLLQHQETTSDLSWSWRDLGSAEFLPRVVLGNIVVSLARWRIDGELAQELGQDRTRVQAWREVGQVPRFAFIAEFDNQLLIDFENPLAVGTFLEHIRKQPETILVEMFPAPGALPVRGPEGSFVHEILVPMVRRTMRPLTQNAAKTSASVPAASPVPSAASANLSVPGAMTESDWLFAKLYCSPSHADRLLLEMVRPLVEEVVTARHADGWFFARYGDPHWHLRLRFHGDPATLRAHVLPLLLRRAERFRRQGAVWKLEFDNYEPEVERYGGPHGIGIAERLFQLDSELCMALLPLTSSDAGSELRWRLAFCGVDRLLSGLGFSTAEKKTLAENMRDSREQAWVVDQTYRRQLARKFRSDDLRPTLSAILHDSAGSIFPAQASSAFARFSTGLQHIRKQLEDRRQANELDTTIADLAVSYVHMYLNRMFRAAHHEQEAVLYDLLARSYSSELVSETRTKT